MVQKMRKMKDSGIEWIGEIPEGWRTINPKALFTQRKDRASKGERQLTSSQQYGILYQDEYMELTGSKIVTVEKDFDILKHVEAGDFVISMRSFQGGLEYSTKSGAISSAYVMLVPNLELVYPRFYRWLLKSSVYIDALQRTTNMVRDGQAMRYSNFAQVRLFTLPLDEQKSRADFLDLECSSIDKILFKTRSSIEEYKKLKQAVITQAVTKGVRGEREMKDSGVEWIGEIPKEWRKTQLRHCATIKSGITLGKSYSKDTILIERPYLRVANVQGGYVDLNDLATIEVTPDEDLKYRLHSGDVLMTEGGDRDKLGRGCVWHGEIEPCLHQNHVFAVQTNETILLPEFLEYLTASNVGRSYFDVTAIKTTNLACTSSSKVLAFTIPLPPIEEQIEIVNFIKKRSLELNKLIMKKGLLVQELENYKKSLIYEVVTGKREV